MDLLWVPELQRRLDEEGAPITVITVHPGTVSTGTRPLHLETQQQYTLTYALHRRADWIQSVVAKPVHYADVHTANQRRLDGALRGDERARATEREKYKGAYIEPFGKVVRPGLKEVHDRASAHSRRSSGRRRTACPTRCSPRS